MSDWLPTLPTLPRLARDHTPIPGRLRVEPEDFVVDEVPAYDPEREGEHLFVRFRKRGLTTPEAVRRIANALGVDPREAGWAGLKDRHAVTTQWASFQGATEERARDLAAEGIDVLEVAPHRHKLRVGHLRANRFVLRIRDAAERIDDARAILLRLEQAGVPNYFGVQRFGRVGDNATRARRWLVDGGRSPRKPFERKLLVSALQSSLFNEVLAARLRDGLFEHPVPGDLWRKEDSGGLFTTTELEEARGRMARWEVSPTGPMFGPKMRWPEDEARDRERAALERGGLSEEVVRRFGKLGPGTRRPLRVPLRHLEVAAEDRALVLTFELPSGAYATAVTRELLGEERAPGAHPQ